MEMRSYQAARTFFSILGFLSWCIIVLGAIVALFGIAAAGQTSRGFAGPAVAGLVMLPLGIVIMFLGFLGLVFVQSGRANVDTAELTQQGLKIAREQLEISKQALKQGAALERGYVALQAAKADLQTEKPTAAASSYSDAKPVTDIGSNGSLSSGDAIDHKGTTIRVVEAGYAVGDAIFDTLENAKAHIEGQVLTVSPQPEQPKPYGKQLGVNRAVNPNAPKPS
ncbi:hypothetical protein GV827_16020 [Sulfitobacter sp. JBTF-M27]|uniref:Uncharacterized protein n=1 Tax=Sulfitobacter sediminilitoris TaxID=2698830 RepID=A0A6P0CCL6_9RHOB|nr:tetraspanin family protein [Sulfitobacter sediminilitoris]NEK23902.1 hypothetical protein [Sulfitobacter sediminilitoris]